MLDVELTFTAEVWVYTSTASWYFVTLPDDIADQVKFFRGSPKGFGSVAVAARVGKTKWQTRIFPNKGVKSFILPLKANVRNAENISAGDTLDVTLYLDV